MNTKITFV